MSSIKRKGVLKPLLHRAQVTTFSPFMILLILLIGCGGQTQVLKAPVEISTAEVEKKVAVFPLADYSQLKPFVKPYKAPNLLIIEEITQNLIGYGFGVAIQEDVNEVLISEKILMPAKYPEPLPSKILDRLASSTKDPYGRWDGVSFNPPHIDEGMKKTYKREFLDQLNKQLESKKPDAISLSFLPQSIKGLDRKTVTRLARGLDVDIVFRGRILEYGFKGKESLNPIDGAGILTFLIDEPKRFFFGVTSKAKYDTGEHIRDAVESAIIGGGIGAGIGAAAHGAETGGLIGAGLGVLRTGKKLPVESSIMHVRLYAQDGKTGRVLWTNAIEVERSPMSRFAFDENHPKVMLDKLTREGVKLLVSDFVENTGFLN